MWLPSKSFMSITLSLPGEGEDQMVSGLWTTTLTGLWSHAFNTCIELGRRSGNVDM